MISGPWNSIGSGISGRVLRTYTWRVHSTPNLYDNKSSLNSTISPLLPVVYSFGKFLEQQPPFAQIYKRKASMWLRHRVEIYRRLANLRNLSMGNYLRFGMGQFLAQSMNDKIYKAGGNGAKFLNPNQMVPLRWGNSVSFMQNGWEMASLSLPDVTTEAWRSF